MPKRLLPPWPQYHAEEIDAVKTTLRSGKVNYWTGDEGRQFESEFADYHGSRHAIALANGTLALELAMRALGIGAGDEVIVTPRSYFASASSIVVCGASPVFVDVDADSQNIRVDTIAAAVSSRTRAILAVHLAGWPCDMPAIMDIARRHNLKVIEDCAQAHGARIDDRLVGTFSDAGSFSFCQDKILSTGGEGGMLLTDSEELWKSAWSFKDHGKNWDKVSAPAHSPGFRWLHDSFGSNYRLTEMQAAIGRIQLRRLGDWIEKRRVNAQQLIEGLSGLPALRIPVPERNVTHAYYKFYAFVVRERLRSGWDRDRILDALQAEGAPGWSGSCPEIYREKAFDTVAHNSLPVARELGRTSIMLPVHPTLSGDDMAWLIDVLRRVMNKATRKF
jgi:dTDP-4-amino-4,6-dideoxygalactose transaminase